VGDRRGIFSEVKAGAVPSARLGGQRVHDAALVTALSAPDGDGRSDVGLVKQQLGAAAWTPRPPAVDGFVVGAISDRMNAQAFEQRVERSCERVCP
jgi:hypothetical protein